MDLLLNLPDDLWYEILTFTSAPTERATVLCHCVIPLCSDLRDSMERGRPELWSAILDEYVPTADDDGSNTRTASTATTRKSAPTRFWFSKRLRFASKKEEVQFAHGQLCERMVNVHCCLTELIRSKDLTVRGLRGIFENYSPGLQYDRRFTNDLSLSPSYGDTFLVECCRAAVKEKIVLSCVKELVLRRGVRLDHRPPTSTSSSSSLRTTPLCVAASRDMPSVVKFLLENGASVRTKGTVRFLISRNPNRSVEGTFEPLEIAKIVLDAKIEQKGADNRSEIRLLRSCVRILEVMLNIWNRDDFHEDSFDEYLCMLKGSILKRLDRIAEVGHYYPYGLEEILNGSSNLGYDTYDHWVTERAGGYYNWKASIEIKDKDGKLPIHIAADKGLKWEEGTKQILKANYAALKEKDIESRMYPFMLAAVGPHSDLDSVYGLLRHNPTLAVENLTLD